MKRLSMAFIMITCGIAAMLQAEIQYGADLLQGKGNFETPEARLMTSEGGIWSFFQGRGVAEFSTTDPYEGSYHWYAYETGASGDVRISASIETVPNRRHQLSFRNKYNNSKPPYNQTNINGAGWYSFTVYTTYSLRTLTFEQPQGDNMADFSIRFYGDSTIGDDQLMVDNITLTRERTVPYVVADSVNSQVITGDSTPITFTCSNMIDPNETFAFDPDIQITSAQAAVANVTWIDDAHVTADITANADGNVTLTFTNVYSQRSVGYTLTAGSPTQCGDIATNYLAADITGAPDGKRDCNVDLADFAALSEQWLQCTDSNNLDCNHNW